MFNHTKFLKDYNIPTDSTKNVSEGWVGIRCPFNCQDSSNHGAFSPEGNYNCWICGKHSLPDVISALLHVSRKKARHIYHRYTASGSARQPSLQKQSFQPKKSYLDFPPGTGPLLKKHKKYLQKREFNPDQLERDWKLLGTNHLGDYSWRIIAPIYFKEQLISYQGRDITDKSYLRYKACREENEIIKFKHVLYGYDNIPNNKIIIVEGITDVWKLGYGAVATFGLSYTWEQFYLMLEFDKLYILFDSAYEAQQKAKELASKLVTFNKEVEILEIDKDDPAELNEDDINEVMRLIK